MSVYLNLSIIYSKRKRWFWHYNVTLYSACATAHFWRHSKPNTCYYRRNAWWWNVSVWAEPATATGFDIL